jgi:hypothetical protein
LSLRVSIPPVVLGCGNFGGIGSAPAFFGKGETKEAAFALMDADRQTGRPGRWGRPGICSSRSGR